MADRIAGDTGADAAQVRWQQVAEHFDAVIDLPPAARTALLAARCGTDAALRAEVETLLAAAERRDGLLDGTAREFAAPLLHAAPAPADGSPGARIGPFRVIRELGHGGMGAVYLAERADPELRQRVAIKLLRDGLGPELLLRFLEERQILANLDHPAIARLVDGGLTPDGVPWFAMEHVEGVRLDRYCDEHALSIEERLTLFCRVCDAVQYAHQNLVVHQDLKPSNILVTAEGQPKLLDFGIARFIGAQSAVSSITHPAVMQLLTPAFASPEQARGEPVSTASDVYALGVLLYLLLTGSHPFRSARGAQCGLPGGHDSALAPPSARVVAEAIPEAVAAAAARRTTPAHLRRRLRGDLDAIVLQAMRTDPDQRYQAADHLATELRRHLAGLPVAARPQTRGYRLGRYVSRNRRAVGAGSVAAALLLAFGILTTVQSLQIRAQAERITAERDRAQHVEGFLMGLLQDADPYRSIGSGITVRELLDRGEAQLHDAAPEPPEIRARLMFVLGKAYRGLGEYDRAIALLDSAHALHRRLNGPTHAQTLGAANQLADALRVAGRYDEARELYHVIVASRRDRYGERSPEVARSLNGLAMVLRMKGEHAHAERLLREALSIDREHAASEPAGLTQSLNNLGHVVREQGDLPQAEALHRESLAARRTLWGDEHFEVSVSLSNLAAVLRDRGDFAAADSVFRLALALRQRLVGDQHPDLATDRAGYARLLQLRGDHAAAEELFRQALAVHRRALPNGHPVTAATLLGLGQVLTAQGDARAAEPLLREALAAQERTLGPDHSLTAEARSALRAAAAPRRTVRVEAPTVRGR